LIVSTQGSELRLPAHRGSVTADGIDEAIVPPHVAKSDRMLVFPRYGATPEVA
jgi:hypothetical protein